MASRSACAAACSARGFAAAAAAAAATGRQAGRRAVRQAGSQRRRGGKRRRSIPRPATGETRAEGRGYSRTWSDSGPGGLGRRSPAERAWCAISMRKMGSVAQRRAAHSRNSARVVRVLRAMCVLLLRRLVRVLRAMCVLLLRRLQRATRMRCAAAARIVKGAFAQREPMRRIAFQPRLAMHRAMLRPHWPSRNDPCLLSLPLPPSPSLPPSRESTCDAPHRVGTALRDDAIPTGLRGGGRLVETSRFMLVAICIAITICYVMLQ